MTANYLDSIPRHNSHYRHNATYTHTRGSAGFQFIGLQGNRRDRRDVVTTPRLAPPRARNGGPALHTAGCTPPARPPAFAAVLGIPHWLVKPGPLSVGAPLRRHPPIVACSGARGGRHLSGGVVVVATRSPAPTRLLLAFGAWRAPTPHPERISRSEGPFCASTLQRIGANSHRLE